MKLSSFLIVPLTFRRTTSHKMYLLSRTASLARLFFLLSFCGLIMYIVGIYTFHVAFTSVTLAERSQNALKNYPAKSIDGEKAYNTADLKYILLWTIPNFNYSLDVSDTSIFKESGCDYMNCYLTTNKSLLNDDITKFDAIVFSISTLRRWKRYMPLKRSVKQKYVFYSMMPSSNNPVCNINADSFFNWTWTYKLYSDIVSPFIEVRDLNGNLVAPDVDIDWPNDMVRSYNYSKPKEKALVWYNEHCDNTQAKMYSRELKIRMKEHSLEFDIYGCENKKCPKEGCLKAIEDKYLFYLAFEDSFSDDYVTKEVLKGLQHNAVPIVMGGADYSRFLPPGSYIDGRYETPEQLASLLEYISKNPASYNKYFNWKKYYTIQEANFKNGYCQLCELLNDKKRTESYSAYEAFRKWWYYGNLQEKCFPKGAETFDDVLSYIEDAELRKKYAQDSLLNIKMPSTRT